MFFEKMDMLSRVAVIYRSLYISPNKFRSQTENSVNEGKYN